MRTEDYKKEFFTILFAQKQIIIFVTVLISIAGIFIAFFWPPTYASYGSVLVKVKKALKTPETIEEAQLSYTAITKEDLASEVEMMTSPEVIEKTINILKKKKEYEENGKDSDIIKNIKKSVREVKLLFSDKKRNRVDSEVYIVQESLKTEIVPVSNVIEITYHHRDPEYSKLFLNTLLEQYIKHRMNIYYPEEAEKYFSTQTGTFGKELDNKSREWIDIIEKNRIAEPLREIENNLVLKKDLETQLTNLENLAIERRMQVQYLEKALSTKGVQFYTFIDKLSFTNLSTALQQLFVEYGNVLRKYTSESEKAKVVEEQLNSINNAMRKEVKSYKDSLSVELNITEEKITQLKEALQDISDRNVELQKQNINNQKIMMELNLLRLSYETFSKRKGEASLGSLSPANSYVSVLKSAFPSNGPIFPRKKVILPLSILIGFVAGCSVGFLREFFDHTFKKIGDVERVIGIPVIFSVPDSKEK